MGIFSDESPIVSFIVSVYNLEKYIAECLDSILAQPFDNFEIILVDNGSMDNSRAICEEYAVRHKQIQFFALSGNPVIGRPILYAQKKVKGKYIHIVDGDDILPIDAYTDDFISVLRNKTPDIIFGQFKLYSENKNILNWVDNFFSAECINDVAVDTSLEYLRGHLPFHIPQWRLIVKKSVFLEIFSTPQNLKYKSLSPSKFSIYLDQLSALSYLLRSNSIYYIPKPLYIYRVRASSLSRLDNTQLLFNSFILIIRLTWMKCFANSKSKMLFVNEFINAWFYTFLVALSAINEDKFNNIIADIKTLKPLLQEMNSNEKFKLFIGNNEIHSFIKEIFQNDIINAIKNRHFECSSYMNCICETLKSKNKLLYIAPTGNAGSCIYDTLIRQNISISGFFDNDEQKNGMEFKGVPIKFLPAIAEISEKESIIIIIASMYQNIRVKLKQQFLSLGVSDNNLVIIEF